MFFDWPVQEDEETTKRQQAEEHWPLCSPGHFEKWGLVVPSQVLGSLAAGVCCLGETYQLRMKGSGSCVCHLGESCRGGPGIHSDESNVWKAFQPRLEALEALEDRNLLSEYGLDVKVVGGINKHPEPWNVELEATLGDSHTGVFQFFCKWGDGAPLSIE